MIPYIIHHCINTECNNAWLDEDLNNSLTPVKRKPCSTCRTKGFSEKQKDPKKVARMQEMQKIRLDNIKRTFLTAIVSKKVDPRGKNLEDLRGELNRKFSLDVAADTPVKVMNAFVRQLSKIPT